MENQWLFGCQISRELLELTAENPPPSSQPLKAGDDNKLSHVSAERARCWWLWLKMSSKCENSL